MQTHLYVEDSFGYDSHLKSPQVKGTIIPNGIIAVCRIPDIKQEKNEVHEH